MCFVFLYLHLFSAISMFPMERRSRNTLIIIIIIYDHLVGLVVKASASGAEDPWFESRLRRDFSGSSHTSKLALQWLPCQVPGVIGSALGLVGPVSVYCDWVRWKDGSAPSISVWQHVELCRSVPEIHSHVAGTLSNQPTNNYCDSYLLVTTVACNSCCNQGKRSKVRNYKMLTTVINMHQNWYRTFKFPSSLCSGNTILTSTTLACLLGR